MFEIFHHKLLVNSVGLKREKEKEQKQIEMMEKKRRNKLIFERIRIKKK